MSNKRPPVRIRFKYNVDTGDIEEFIIDDNAAAASEAYHDKVARAIASRLGRESDIVDAGPVRLPQKPQPVMEFIPEEQEKEEEKPGEELE